MADTEQQKQKLLGGKSTQLPFTVNALQVRFVALLAWVANDVRSL